MQPNPGGLDQRSHWTWTRLAGLQSLTGLESVLIHGLLGLALIWNAIEVNIQMNKQIQKNKPTL